MEATQTIAPASKGVTAGVRELLDRITVLELTNPLAFATLAVAYIGSRIPWLDQGYGTDPDAWRVALTANHLLSEGDYLPSRLPGYPLHELVTAGGVRGWWILEGGWVTTNLSTVLISLVGVYLFAWLARKLELPHRGILTLAFAFAPLLWINSVMTMDYMWALTFLLSAYLALLYRAPTLAGISLGLAAGFRLTSLVMLPPFWLLLWRTDRRQDIQSLTLTSAAVTLGAYTLVLMKYGLNFLNFYDETVPLEEFIKRLGKDGLGIIGALALLAALALSLQRLRRFPDDLRRDAHVLTWTAAIVIFFISYTRLPHEIAYLVPIFPFGFFLMSRYLSRALLVGTLGVIVLAGFVDITSPEDTIGIDTSTFTSARIGKGMLLSDLETLRNQMDFARELRELTITNRDLETPAVVVTGFIYPELVMLYQDELTIGILEEDLEAISQLSDKGLASDERRRIDYVWLLEYDQFRKLQGQGRKIYYTADAARSTFAVYDYRPGYFGALELPLSRDNPSLGEGTATTDR
ncbi:MAG: hypothetical protein A2148_10325 [Chloroflexi bacterium RBG_16_68_14]|nr:MAG: hypothetical protein A2148_10325 [Chloroflexi bacterium RBG_16_68_14]